MKRSRLTTRGRLALLCTGLFVVCGTIVVAITYALVAALPDAKPASSASSQRDTYVAECERTLTSGDLDAQQQPYCEQAAAGAPRADFEQGIYLGAANQRDATLAQLLRFSFGTLAVVTILAALGSWILAGRVLRPIHRITATARAASEHNLSARVSMHGPRDELRELADTFDEMLGRLQSGFDGQRRFIANASHELRTPLTVMGATVDVVLAKARPTQAELQRMGHDVRIAVDDAKRLIEALLTLARNEHGLTVHEQVDLATVAEDVLDSVDAGDRCLRPSLRPAVLAGDPVLLERLVANLVDNAMRYNVSGGNVRIETRTVDGRATLLVANTGPIVAPDAIDGLFEPFRRLRDRTGGDGFGLGLAIVASITAVHDGTVTARPAPDGGLEVAITMPSTDARS